MHGFSTAETNLLARVSMMPLAHRAEEAHDLEAAALEALLLEQPEAGEPQPERQSSLVRMSSLGRLHRASTRQAIVHSMLDGKQGGEDDTLALLSKVRARFDRAGVPMTDVLIRFKNLSITGLVALKQGQRTMSRIASARNSAGRTLQKLKYMVAGAPTSSMRKAFIVEDASSVLHPGRITLLLGPPGAGKTTFMRALSGQLKGEKNIEVVADELTYNGLDFRKGEFVVERTAGYISQVDTHFGELTVRETLNFSALCQTSRTRKAAEVRLEEREKELGIEPDPAVAVYMHALSKAGHQHLYTDIAIKALGLETCADTPVGNAMLRGVSGGQKKRVTTGEIFVGPSNTLFADEISTGLDSATTFDICNRLRALCHTLNATVLVSLLQPTPETYGVFDDVMLLSSGRLVFHGPREMILPFFDSLGFVCPAEKGEADFLQEVTTLGDQVLYWGGEKGTYQFVPERDIAAAYRQTEYGAAFLKELDMPAEQEAEGHEELATHTYGQGHWTLFVANMARQKKLFLRNDAFIIIRIAQCIVMGFAVGTLFLNQGKDTLYDAQMFMSVSFFSIMTQLVVSFAAPGLLIERLPVYYKQRDAGFYPAFCFALPEILMQVPLIFTEACIWTLMVYFMVGFATSARLFIFWGFMMVAGVFGLTLFFVIAMFTKTITVAAAFQNLAILIFTIASGFIVTPDSLAGPWVGAYWANPVTYFLNGIVRNEMLSPDWSEPSENAPGLTAGEEYMVVRGYDAAQPWAIGMFAWGIGATVLNTIIFMLACTYTSAVAGGVEKIEATVEFSRDDLSISSLKSRGSHHGAPSSNGDAEEGGAAARQEPRKGSLPFSPVTLTFSDLKYSVPLPAGVKGKQDDDGPHSGRLLLLRGITGSFRPGVLTALMGSSGAGKTTLMDCLALRKTGGLITGDVRVSGFPQKADTFMRVMGYVEQTDVHIPEATVHEALLFSARLRLPSSTKDDAAVKFVEEVMDVVELQGLRNARVGIPGVSGLSVEQRKRLTIAVELVANPSIVFMDEPTSGLDARAAGIVMRAVKRITSTGRTVVCTIHQPNREIFLAFDELLLLKRGGETIFNGDLGKGGSNLTSYFEGFNGVPKITKGQNPANWMLDVTSAEVEKATRSSFADNYALSELAEQQEQLVASLAVPVEGAGDLQIKELAPASVLVQVRELLKRNLQQYNRLRSYTATRMAITIVIGVLFGTVLDNQGDKAYTYNGILNVTGVQYSSVMFIGMVNAMMVQSIISLRRTVFYRERSGGTYTVFPYILTEFLVEVPYLIVQAVVYSALVYWIVGFQANAGKFFWFLGVMIFTLFYWTFFGIQNVHITPSLSIANAFTSFCFGVWDLFCGYYKPSTMMTPAWIWMYYIDPVSYTIWGLIAGELGDVEEPMLDQNPVVTVSQFVESYFGYYSGAMSWIIPVLFAFSAAFFCISALALKKIQWQNR